MTFPLKIGQPRFLTLDEVLALHRASTDVYGGIDGVVDIGRLESSLAMAAQGVAGAFAHSFPFEMAAAYGFHLAMNHPFRDGNKRTALAAMVAFLRMNGWDVVVEDPGTADQILELIEQHQSQNWLAHWLEDNSRSRPSFELRDFFSAITYEADWDALQSFGGIDKSVRA